MTGVTSNNDLGTPCYYSGQLIGFINQPFDSDVAKTLDFPVTYAFDALRCKIHSEMWRVIAEFGAASVEIAGIGFLHLGGSPGYFTIRPALDEAKPKDIL